jgi:hypothetical protein
MLYLLSALFDLFKKLFFYMLLSLAFTLDLREKLQNLIAFGFGINREKFWTYVLCPNL